MDMRMIKELLLGFIFLAVTAAYAQPQFIRTQAIDIGGYDELMEMHLDNNGETYISHFSDKNSSNKKIQVSKLDASLNLIPIIQSQGVHFSNPRDMFIQSDTNGYTYMGFFIRGDFVIGNDTINGNSIQIGNLNVVKTFGDSLIWHHVLPVVNNFPANHYMKTTESGTTYFMNSFGGTKIIGNDTLIAGQGRRVYLTKISSQGTIKWARAFSIPNSTKDIPWSIQIDQNKDIRLYITQTWGSTYGFGRQVALHVDTNGNTVSQAMLLDITDHDLQDYYYGDDGKHYLLMKLKGSVARYKDSLHFNSGQSLLMAVFDQNYDLDTIVDLFSSSSISEIHFPIIKRNSKRETFIFGYSNRDLTYAGDSIFKGGFIINYDKDFNFQWTQTFARSYSNWQNGNMIAEVAFRNDSTFQFIVNPTGPNVDFGSTIYNQSSLDGYYVEFGPRHQCFNKVDTSIQVNGRILSSNASNASFQWLDCNNGSAILLGDTTSVLNATTGGNFALEINMNGCVDTSRCVRVIGVGIDENNSNAGMAIFPNPSGGYVFLKFQNKQNIRSIKVRNILGQDQEFSWTEENQSIKIDASSLPNGIYLMTLESEIGTLTKKFIKQNAQ